MARKADCQALLHATEKASEKLSSKTRTVTKTNIKVKKQKMYIVCHDSPASVSISLTSQTVEDNIEEGGDDQHYHKAPSMKPMIEITSVTPSGDKAEEIQDSEQITVDLTEIATQLQREPLAEWIVGDINVTQRFRKYQKDVLAKAEIDGLTWNDIYEVLALSFVIVFKTPCPYLVFTKGEWQK
ncbi:hypothetical protein BC938DRAFT_471249 [Jimgerdemannia flammicorona]|uniref:Uncharacterized protein n=1 Tax=Jimgerdemannia flammicorona TaxID=994334 RepID=A0A433Q8H7_9FUNG|nr:hypothetical protein BC938DRAFT_471249 [Jimgerdemannia flammicorona]